MPIDLSKLDGMNDDEIAQIESICPSLTNLAMSIRKPSPSSSKEIAMPQRPALKNAFDAVDQLFSDGSVDQGQTKVDLEEIIEHIKSQIESLDGEE